MWRGWRMAPGFLYNETSLRSSFDMCCRCSLYKSLAKSWWVIMDLMSFCSILMNVAHKMGSTSAGGCGVVMMDQEMETETSLTAQSSGIWDSDPLPQHRVQTFQQCDRSRHMHQLPQTKAVHVPIGIGTARCLLIPSPLSLSSTTLCIQHCMFYSTYLPLVSGLFPFLSLRYLTNVLTVIYMLIFLYHHSTLEGYWLPLNLHPQGVWLIDVQGLLHRGWW